jgi:ubiquinone biosynthesis protein UbiJ
MKVFNSAVEELSDAVERLESRLGRLQEDGE